MVALPAVPTSLPDDEMTARRRAVGRRPHPHRHWLFSTVVAVGIFGLLRRHGTN